MELISLKCSHPKCSNVLVLELLEKGESARFKKIGGKAPGGEDIVVLACPSGHQFNVSFASLHRTSFQS